MAEGPFVESTQVQYRYSGRFLIVVALLCFVSIAIVANIIVSRAVEFQGLSSNQSAVADNHRRTSIYYSRWWNQIGRSLDYDARLESEVTILLLNDRSERVPAAIERLDNLVYLEAKGGTFGELPTEVGALSRLTGLNLRNGKLKRLPPSIGKLTELKYLYVDGNELKGLPVEFQKLKSLKRLSLTGNSLTDADLLVLAKLKSLEALFLKGNHVTRGGVETLQKELPNCEIH